MNAHSLTKKQIVLIMAGTMLTLLPAALDNTIVSTAMPKIILDLNGMEHYAWPFTAYMLFSTIILPISGKLADIYGRKKVTLFGITVFAITSICCGSSHSMIELSILRGFQGVGGGICISSAFIIVSEIFPMGKRAKYIGIITSMFALTSIMGPGAGGIITDYLSWRWVFFVNIPLGIIAFVLIAKNLPAPVHHDDKRKIDIYFNAHRIFSPCRDGAGDDISHIHGCAAEHISSASDRSRDLAFAVLPEPGWNHRVRDIRCNYDVKDECRASRSTLREFAGKCHRACEKSRCDCKPSEACRPQRGHPRIHTGWFRQVCFVVRTFDFGIDRNDIWFIRLMRTFFS